MRFKSSEAATSPRLLRSIFSFHLVGMARIRSIFMFTYEIRILPEVKYK